jgi:hypothetical protein
MACLSYKQVKVQLFERIPQSVVSNIQLFVDKNSPTLWGEKQPRQFLKHMVILAHYKDAFKVGFQRLVKNIDFGYKITHKSLQKNIERLRPVIKRWAQTQLNLGTVHDWNQAVRNCGLQGEVKEANMWMDSTDFPLEGIKSVSRKSPDWSYKLNRPGRRYMVLRDGNGKILKLWGGYSPKIYDGTWLEINKDELENTIPGAVILADSHFSKGKKLFQNIKFLTNFVVPNKGRKRKRNEENEGENLSVLTKAQEKFNAAHKQARARVESPFGFMKTKIDSLTKPWSESVDQLDCLVWIAAAIHNKCL